jgi:hypothetical protein
MHFTFPKIRILIYKFLNISAIKLIDAKSVLVLQYVIIFLVKYMAVPQTWGSRLEMMLSRMSNNQCWWVEDLACGLDHKICTLAKLEQEMETVS